MVGTTSPQSPPARPSYAEIGALMARKPVRAAAKNEREFQAARVSWLFEMADALGGAGLDEDADSVREAALRLVQTAVSELTGVRREHRGGRVRDRHVAAVRATGATVSGLSADHAGGPGHESA